MINLLLYKYILKKYVFARSQVWMEEKNHIISNFKYEQDYRYIF